MKPFKQFKFKVYPRWNTYNSTTESPSDAAKFMSRARTGWMDNTQFNNCFNNGCANGWCVSMRGGDTSAAQTTGFRARYSVATVIKFRNIDNKAGYKP